jgi:hypothetical protein
MEVQMNKKYLVILVIVAVVIIFGLVFVPFRTDGSFTHFESTADVEEFLAASLQLNTSTLEDVNEFMRLNTSKSDRCGEPRIPSAYTEFQDADEVVVCLVVMEPTWIWQITSYWYHIVFYFKDGILLNFTVDTSNAGL